MTTTNEYEVEGSFNLRKPRHNIMYTLFYSNISEFAVNPEGIIYEETCKTSIGNMHKLVWEANYFKPSDVSMLVHGCGVSLYPQFYDITKKSNLTTPIHGKLLR